MKLGVNTVLYKSFDLRTALEGIRLAGYDGAELSAIAGMCEHIVLDEWQSQADSIRAMAEEIGIELLSMEVASRDEARLEKAFAAAQALGIGVVNIGPGGKKDVPEGFDTAMDILRARAELAGKYGVKLCCKAHVGCSVWSTPTTIRMIEQVQSPFFGVDMDPSHIYRAGELPEEALAAVVARMGHVHIRDCVDRGPGPGAPALQACGRGEINLYGYFKALVDANYQGPVCLEVIGPPQTLQQAQAIASESYGYMNAILKQLGAR